MTKRIFRAIFLVALAVMLAVAGLILGMTYRYSYVETQKELRREVEYVASGLETEGVAYLNRFYDTENRITWIDGEGRVLFDSVAEPSKMENHKEREEIQEALKTGWGSSERYSRTLSEKTLYQAKRMADGTVVRVSVVTLSIMALFMTMTQPMALILAAMIGLSFFLALQTARHITKPINAIDLEKPETAEVYEELTPLLRRIAVQNKEIHRQMKELKRRKEEFDTITANMQEGLLVLDPKGDVLSYNDGLCQLLGVASVREGQNVFTLNRSEGFRRSVEGALAGAHCEERIEIGGSICQVFANPVLQEGDRAGVILILFDITEKAERERLRREFTANVSHELKTPLTSISGFAEIMKNGMVRPQDMGNFAGKIYDEAQRLIVLVQDIIKLSKLDEKDSLMEKEWVRLDEIVLETAERLQPEAQRQSVTLTAAAEPVSVWGVKQVLSEVVSNLCNNALRYNKPEGQVAVSLQKRGQELLLEVADTGIGIAKEEQERIFERFYRVDESRTAGKGGTGLGLSIVKHGIALHGGRVFVESERDKGTTMRVFLPLQEQNKESK